MTEKKSRRVVIINNIQSESIDQAIFILKSASEIRNAKAEANIAAEAQTIINNYINRVEHISESSKHTKNSSKSHTKVPLWLKFILITAITAAFILFTFQNL